MTFCHCSRPLKSEMLCETRITALPLLECVENKALNDDLLKIMIPIKFTLCCKRFADFGSCDKHVTTVHIAKQTTSSQIVPRAMSVKS